MEDVKILEGFNKLSERKKESLLYALRILNRPTPELVEAEKTKIGSFPEKTEQRISKLTSNELNYISDNRLHQKMPEGGGSGNTIVLTCKCEEIIDGWDPRVLVLGIEDGIKELLHQKVLPVPSSGEMLYPDRYKIGPDYQQYLAKDETLNLAIPEGFDALVITVFAKSIEWLSGGPDNSGKKKVTPDIPHIEGDIEMLDFDPYTNYARFLMWGDAAIYAYAYSWDYNPVPLIPTYNVTFTFEGGEAEQDFIDIVYIRQYQEDGRLYLDLATLYTQEDTELEILEGFTVLIITDSGRFLNPTSGITVDGDSLLNVTADGTVEWGFIQAPF